MEKICEFCSALRPIVFCKADSAFLCLSCDAKVHSANALSNRHFRCLVCESCREQSAYIRCLDHQLLMCRACDVNLHDNIARVNQHQRRTVSSFTGSPSAKQFAILCGFNMNQLTLDNQLAGPSMSSVSAGSVVSTDFSAGSSRPEQNKMSGKDEQQSSSVMQQILDLNRLQLNESNNPSTTIRERGKAHSSSSCVYNSLVRIDECLEDATMHNSNGPADDLNALKEQHFFPLPMSQSEYLSSYTTATANFVVGDPFWQSRTALESNQFWPQNVEEPRFSEEIDGLDDFKIPEVDMTFPNFEELLKGDQDLSKALLEDNSTSFFCSIEDLHSAHATGISVHSAMNTIDQMIDEKNHHTHSAHQDYQNPENIESNTRMRPSYSYSYSFSNLSVESSGSDCHDPLLDPSQLEAPNIEGHRLKHKKKSKLHPKQTQLSPKKNKAEPNRKLNVRFVKPEDEKNHGMKATRSC